MRRRLYIVWLFSNYKILAVIDKDYKIFAVILLYNILKNVQMSSSKHTYLTTVDKAAKIHPSPSCSRSGDRPVAISVSVSSSGSSTKDRTCDRTESYRTKIRIVDSDFPEFLGSLHLQSTRLESRSLIRRVQLVQTFFRILSCKNFVLSKFFFCFFCNHA